MAFPSVKLTTLASLAHRLPAACWLAQRLEQAPERWATLPVWWVEGDLDMAGLDGSAALAGVCQPPVSAPCRRKWPSTHSRAPSGWGALPSSAVEGRGGSHCPSLDRVVTRSSAAMSRSPSTHHTGSVAQRSGACSRRCASQQAAGSRWASDAKMVSLTEGNAMERKRCSEA